MKKLFKSVLLIALSAFAITACENNEPVEPNEKPSDIEIPNEGPTEEEAFEIEVTNIETTSAMLSISPADDSVYYYYDLMPEEDYIVLNGDVGVFFGQMLNYYIQLYPSLDVSSFLVNMLSKGASSDAVQGLTPGATYYAYAVVVDPNTGETGDYSLEKFTALEGGDPAACSFELTIRKTYATEVEFSIAPSDSSVGYWYAVTAVNSYPGDTAMQQSVQEELETYASDNGMTIEEIAARVVCRGPIDDLWFELDNSTDYYLYVYAMGPNGEAAGPIYKEMFTTEKYDVSTAEVDLAYHIFDGADIYAQDNSLDPAVKEYAVLQYEVTPNYMSGYWLVQLAAGDMTDLEKYPDESTLNAMLSGNVTFNKLVSHYYVEWDSVATLLWFAADYDMIYGPVKRMLVEVTKDNVSSIDHYKEAAKTDIPYIDGVSPASKASHIAERKMQRAKVGRQIAF